MYNNVKNAKSLLLFFRQKKGLSQYKMARWLGISRDVLANYENDRTRIPADILLKFDLSELYQDKPANQTAQEAL
jgi:transcriptional regulator with XRE-family HTH domain